MRIAFVGASRFGARILEGIEASKTCTVVGAVTAPAKFRISYSDTGVSNALHADLSDYFRRRNIPMLMLKDRMDEPGLLEGVALWRPDVFIVAGWYHMVPAAWRRLAPAYGLHASLLPDYSGGAPLVWAIINGEKETGITMFELSGGVDDGPIIGQRRTAIGADETIADVYARIENLGVELVRDCLDDLAAGTATFSVQDEKRRRTFPQRSPDDGEIDWRCPSKAVHDFVRAQTKPYPGAFFLEDGRRVTVWSGRIARSTREGLDIGQFAVHDGALLVGCGDGSAYELTQVEDARLETSGIDWYRATERA